MSQRVNLQAPAGAATRARKSAASRAPAAAERGQRNLVNSLAKGLRVLESFRAERLEMTLSEIASAAGLDPGTAFRMINTLEAAGYLARVPDSRKFRLTLKAADLGLHAIGQTDLREVARPILRSLVGEVNEGASLGVLDGGDILYVERMRAGVSRLGVDIRIGTTIPAPYSIIGHALLAFLPEADLDRVLSVPPRRAMMPAEALTRKDIRRHLAETKSRGFALGDSFLGNGLHVLAVPVLDIDGYPIAAISVVAPAFCTDLKGFQRDALVPLRAAANALARAVQAGGSFVAVN